MKQPILHLSRHTGMLFAFQMQPMKFQADPAQLRPLYIKIQKHCLLFGWWSVLSLFFLNPATILLNAYNWHSYKKKYAKYMQHYGIPGNPIS